MNTTSEELIYKVQIMSESCEVQEAKLYVAYKEQGYLLDSAGQLVNKYHEFQPDSSGIIFFEAGTTQSRCPSESPDYLHSAPLLLYFDHPTCKDYYDSIPAERLKKLVRISPEESGYALKPYEVGVWQLPTLHIEPDTAYFEAEAEP